MLNLLRNLVRHTSRDQRDAVRADALHHAQLAREEVRRARDQRRLDVLDSQYRRRVKGRGKPA